MHLIGSAMRRSDNQLVRNAQAFKLRGASLHGRKIGLRTHDDTDNGRFLCHIHASRLRAAARMSAPLNYNVFSIDAPSDVGQIAVAFPQSSSQKRLLCNGENPRLCTSPRRHRSAQQGHLTYWVTMRSSTPVSVNPRCARPIPYTLYCGRSCNAMADIPTSLLEPTPARSSRTASMALT